MDDPAPAAFVCPILYDVMRDPVTTIDGYTYERRAIERWLCTNRTSPLTGLALKSLRLTPNRSLKAAIEHWLTTPPCKGGPKTPRCLLRRPESTETSPRVVVGGIIAGRVVSPRAGGSTSAAAGSPRRAVVAGGGGGTSSSAAAATNGGSNGSGGGGSPRRPWLPSSPSPRMAPAHLPLSTGSPRPSSMMAASGIETNNGHHHQHAPSRLGHHNESANHHVNNLEQQQPVSARRANATAVRGTGATAAAAAADGGGALSHRTPRMSGAAVQTSVVSAPHHPPTSAAGGSTTSGAAAAIAAGSGPAATTGATRSSPSAPGQRSSGIVISAPQEAAGHQGGPRMSASSNSGLNGGGGAGDFGQLPQASAELRSIARLLKSSIEGGVVALVRGMRSQGAIDDAALQEVACVTIASIVVRNPAAKAQVAAAGGLEACIDALYAHAENPGVQEAGCKALANTVANCSAGLEDRAAAAGGVNAVLASLTNHHEAGYVVEAACAALANLTANSAAVRDYAGVHAVEAVLEAMRDYPDHLGVMGAAAQALANLVALNHAGHQRAALVGGGAEAILGLLAHLNRIGSSRTEQVAKAALRAIRNLGASDETAGRLLSEGVQERVFKCMDVHAFSPAVVEVACQAIANLAVAVIPPDDDDDDRGGPAGRSSGALGAAAGPNPAVELIDAGVVDAVGTALRAHPACEAVQTAGLTALLSVLEGIAGPAPPPPPPAAAVNGRISGGSRAAAAAAAAAAAQQQHQQQQQAAVTPARQRGVGVSIRTLARAAQRQLPASRELQALARQIVQLAV